MLLGWDRSQIIESITKMLGVLPIPIYLLPDENVARYPGGRAISVGRTWAAEIQRALTATEQFAKRCFDIFGAASVLLLFLSLMLLRTTAITSAHYAFRNLVKPGITGWAQVNGYRDETPTIDLMSKRVERSMVYPSGASGWISQSCFAR